jgi:hypothetical protein
VIGRFPRAAVGIGGAPSGHFVFQAALAVALHGVALCYPCLESASMGTRQAKHDVG